MGFFGKLFGSDKPKWTNFGRVAAGSAPEYADAAFEAATGQKFFKPGQLTWDPNAPKTGVGMIDALTQYSQGTELPLLKEFQDSIESGYGNIIGANGSKFLESFSRQRTALASRGKDSLTGNLRANAARAARSGFKSTFNDAGITRAVNQDTLEQGAEIDQREMAGRSALMNAVMGRVGALSGINDARRQSLLAPYMARLNAIQSLPGFAAPGAQYQDTGLLNRVIQPVTSLMQGIGSLGQGLGWGRK